MRIQNLVMDPSAAAGPDDAEKLTVRFEVVALKRP
jgi:hypothetical protein